MYVDQILTTGETVLQNARPSLWTFFGRILLGIILLPVFGIGLYFLISAWLTYTSTELAVTNRRIIAKYGVIRRHAYEMNLDKVESFQVEQGIAGRLLDFGTILVRGTGSSFEPIVGISQPLEFRKAVAMATDAMKIR